MGGQHDHRRGATCLNVLSGLNAIHLGHVHVHQNDVRPQRLGHLDATPSVLGCAGEESAAPDLTARIGDRGLGYEQFEAYLEENSVDPDFGWGSDVLSALFDQFLDEELLRQMALDRGVATLESGESMEDLVFVYSPDAVERIDVQLVELYTSVLDDQGRFVGGLTAEDFRVLEDGAPQAIRRFDKVENLAINVALLMDVSTSMRKKIRIATRSAQRFFETVLTPKDRASLLTFNHDIRLIVPFTNDALDPIAKIPELKVCAVKVQKIPKRRRLVRRSLDEGE